MRTRPTLLVPLAALLAACLPGSGEVKILGDGVSATADSAAPGLDTGAVQHDTGTAQDQGAKPDGTAPTADSQGPKPDTLAAGPQPPFGSSMGMTAADFGPIPDCDGTPYTLHSYYNKKKGVLIAMMSPS
jgi:hypothetical protein